MLIRNVLRKSEAQTGSLLLTLTDERLEHAIANAFRHARTVVRDRYNTILLRCFQRNVDDRLSGAAGACSLAGVQEQIVDGALNLFSINQRCAFGRITEGGDYAQALSIRMRAEQRYRALEQQCHRLR